MSVRQANHSSLIATVLVAEQAGLSSLQSSFFMSAPLAISALPPTTSVSVQDGVNGQEAFVSSVDDPLVPGTMAQSDSHHSSGRNSFCLQI